MNEQLTPDGGERAGGEYSLEISCLPVMNFALQQNRRPLLRSVRIANRGSLCLHDAEVVISASPAFFAEYRRTVQSVPAGSVYELRDIDLAMDTVLLGELTEKTAGNITVSLECGGRSAGQSCARIRVKRTAVFYSRGPFSSPGERLDVCMCRAV